MQSVRQSRPIPARQRPGITSHHLYSTSAPAGKIMAQIGNRNENLSGAGQPEEFYAQDPRFLAYPEPLARHISSDQSSFECSTPASPMLGTNYNSFYTLQASSPSSSWFPQLQDVSSAGIGSPYSSQSVATSCEEQSPRIVPEDTVGESSKGKDKNDTICLYPACDAKPFKRCADLDRHYKHKHTHPSQKDSYFCDYSKCARRLDPFHRRDHFRDHLREFHKEDIEKRGSSVDEEWLQQRNMSSTWWRCAKCLVRNSIEHSDYQCPICKRTCQAKRQRLRMRG